MNQSISRDEIREIFLAHGFTIKDGHTDLKDYVYEAAEALIERARVEFDDSKWALIR